MQDKHKQKPQKDQPALSPVWQELLGQQGVNTTPNTDGESIPTLDADPWSELLHEQGNEVVDLQKIHLQMSDQEVEQILQRMEELPEQQPGPASNPGQDKNQRS